MKGTSRPMFAGARALDRWLGRVSAVAAALCGAAVAVLMLLTSVDVVRRFLTGRSIPGVIEYSEVSLVGVVFLGMAIAQRDGSHVRMEALVSRLPGRPRVWAGTTAAALAAVLSGLLTAATANAAAASVAAGEYRYGLAEVPIWPAKVVIPVGLALLTLEFVRSAVRYAASGDETATTGPIREQAEPATRHGLVEPPRSWT